LARGWQAGFNEARPVGGNLSAHGRYVSLVKKEPGSMAPAIAVLGLLRRGYLGTAMLIGLNIHLRQFETVVRSGDVCSSVCTMIWLAGKPRHLGRLAKLGFHSAAYPDTEMRNEEGNQTRAATSHRPAAHGRSLLFELCRLFASQGVGSPQRETHQTGIARSR